MTRRVPWSLLLASLWAMGCPGGLSMEKGDRPDPVVTGDGAPRGDGNPPPRGDGGPAPAGDGAAGDGAAQGKGDGSVTVKKDGPHPDSKPLLPDAKVPKPDMGPVIHRCKATVLTGATSVEKYNNFYNARGRPQKDQEMGWTHDPNMLDLINTVRFGDPPSSVTGDIELLRTAVDFIPEHHNQTTQKNYDLFKTQGLTDSPNAYAGFNSRDFIPASLTRYGLSIFAGAFVNWSNHEWTRLALARCPDCVDGIVTLAALPAEQYVKHHDFFRIMEVRFVTDRAVYAATAEERLKNGDGRLWVSKPFKLLAAIDSSGALYQHITTKASTFQTPPLNQVKIRYRGEISDPLYNVVQSGDIKVVSPYRTGMVAVLIRYSEANDLQSWQVCDPKSIPAGTNMTALCPLEEWGTWRCGPYGPTGNEADQVCKSDSSTLTGFKWLTNSFVSCAQCKIDVYKGCTW